MPHFVLLTSQISLTQSINQQKSIKNDQAFIAWFTSTREKTWLWLKGDPSLCPPFYHFWYSVACRLQTITLHHIPYHSQTHPNLYIFNRITCGDQALNVQVYKGLLASSQLMTIATGFTGSLLFVFLITAGCFAVSGYFKILTSCYAVGNLEKTVFGNNFQTKLGEVCNT